MSSSRTIKAMWSDVSLIIAASGDTDHDQDDDDDEDDEYRDSGSDFVDN